jgi:hypothetical protein
MVFLPLSISVAYEIPKSVANKFPDSHPRHLLNYVFSMKVSFVKEKEREGD